MRPRTDWSRRFDVPIALPDGRLIATLAQARDFLLSLPPAKHDDLVAAATEALLMAAEGRGPVMHANAGIGRVVHGTGKPKPPAGPRPKPAKSFRILR